MKSIAISIVQQKILHSLVLMSGTMHQYLVHIMTHRKDERLIKSAHRKIAQKNTIPQGQPFVWFTRGMMESEAYRALSGNALKVLSRLLIEQMAHAGSENGELICTHSNIANYGVRRQSIKAALSELEYMGFIRIKKGFAYKGAHTPSRYRLTQYWSSDGQAPSNEWKTINAAQVEAFQMRLKAKSPESTNGHAAA